MSRILIALATVVALAVVATPAEAIHPFRRQVVVQRQVIRQPIVRQKVVVQQSVPFYAAPIRAKIYAPPVALVQPQIQYSQPIILRQESGCYPQAQLVAPVVGGSGSACFFGY